MRAWNPAQWLRRLRHTVRTRRLLREYEFKGACSSPDCRCRDPFQWPLCDEFKDFGDNYGCAQCGWPKAAHNPNRIITRTEWVADSWSRLP